MTTDPAAASLRHAIPALTFLGHVMGLRLVAFRHSLSLARLPLSFVASSFENRSLKASNVTAPPSRCRSTQRVVVSRGKQAHRSFRLL